jgi:Kef-type K+ transport system membrane component KefB
MKPMKTISGRDALVRAAVVVVGEVLVVLVVIGIVGIAGADANTVLNVAVIVGVSSAVLAIFLVMSWALLPWWMRRVERRYWNGKMKVDQAEVLRRTGLS